MRILYKIPTAILMIPLGGRDTGSIPVPALYAPVAQLEVRLICNQQVAGSIPVGGFYIGG